MSQTAAPRVPQDRRALIAVDLGAESCRVSLLRWTNGAASIELVHRFPNAPVRATDGSLHWPIQQIIAGVEHGLRLGAKAAPEGIRSIAVDGWAVDYVRLNQAGELLDAPFCYRDERTVEAERELHKRISPERLQELTGIQLQRLNTLYQLYADHLAQSARCARWLNLPEFLLHRWGGAPVAEYTNATHTGMVELEARRWSPEIVRAAELDAAALPTLTPPGTLLGPLTGELNALPAYSSTELIAPACHDTASAIAGIPASGDDWAYISSGTWSLVGTVLTTACNRPSVRAEGFTNLGGVGGTICFHRGVNGMWMLKQCMESWAAEGQPWAIDALLGAAEHAKAPDGLLDVDDPDLLLVGEMPARINRQRHAHGLPVLDESSAGAAVMASLILHSLAARYAQVLRGIERHTGKSLRRLFVVGGGSRNKLLLRLTAEATGLEIICGSPESSTIGNFAVQLATLEDAGPASQEGFRDAVSHWAGQLAPAL